MDKVTLYNRDSTGKIRFWSIKIEEIEFRLEIKHGALGGEVQTVYEDIPDGKGGRDEFEQMESRMNSRINKKIDMGYVRSMDELINRKQVVNSLGFPKPMLAQRIDKVDIVDYENSYIQYKYDGHRCLITKHEGKMVAYTRASKFVETIPEILNHLYHYVDEGVILDGELYCHGLPLNKISSLVKKRQPGTEKVKYICYDVMMPYDYKTRLDFINQIPYSDNFETAITWWDIPEKEIPAILEAAIINGYEGLILRQPEYEYEDNKRSRGLIKIKKFLDDEFKVVDMKQSRDGWAILICETKDGIKFDASAPGSITEKYLVWQEKEKYIGQYVTIKYPNYTPYGKPFQPIAVRFKEEI